MWIESKINWFLGLELSKIVAPHGTDLNQQTTIEKLCTENTVTIIFTKYVFSFF